MAQSSPQPPPSTHLTGEVRIRIRIPPVDVTYHLVTPAQILTYARLGYLLEAFLWVIGLAIGLLITIHLELAKGELSDKAEGIFIAYREAALLVGVAFGLFAIVVYFIRNQDKSAWTALTAEVSD